MGLLTIKLSHDSHDAKFIRFVKPTIYKIDTIGPMSHIWLLQSDRNQKNKVRIL